MADNHCTTESVAEFSLKLRNAISRDRMNVACQKMAMAMHADDLQIVHITYIAAAGKLSPKKTLIMYAKYVRV